MQKRSMLFIIAIALQIGKIDGMEVKETEILAEEFYSDSDSSIDPVDLSNLIEKLSKSKAKIRTLLIIAAEYAISSNDEKSLHECFQPLISVDDQDEDGDTLLHLAIISEQKMMVERLLTNGADVNKKSGKSQIPPLNTAIEFNEEIAKLLLKHNKINPNLSSIKGNTALHSAVRFKKNQLFDLLIKKGADINARNQAGQTPLALALDENEPNYEAAELLIKYSKSEE